MDQRDFDINIIEDDEDVPDPHIPKLTYENAAELLETVDYVTLGLIAKAARKYPPGGEKGLAGNRFRYMIGHLRNEFGSQIYTDDREHLRGENETDRQITAVITNPSTDLLSRFESLLGDLVPVWGAGYIGYCWSSHPAPRADAIIYELEDEMPPQPTSEAYQVRNQELLRKIEVEECVESAKQYNRDVERYNRYINNPQDDPRFKWRPTMIFNGKHGGCGLDTGWLGYKEGISVVFSAYRIDESNMAFPSEDAVIDEFDIELRDAAAADSASKVRLDTDWQRLSEEDCPAPEYPSSDDY